MPAGESTAEEAQAISVDSATTEEDKRPKQQAVSSSSSRTRASSSPKTGSQTRSLSTGHSAKASDTRPSKSVIQNRQTIKKVKDREPPSSPEQPKSRSSSRSTSRRALLDKQSSPSPIAKRSAEPTPTSQIRSAEKLDLNEDDSADAALERAIRAHSQRGLRSNLPVLNLIGHSQSTSHQLIEQLMHAEERMKVSHQEDIRRHEEIAMGLVAKMNEMAQEDQGSTLRIEELERQRDLLRSAVEHVNRVHEFARRSCTWY